ncbi:hypothetical protein DFQ27_001277 [Actinomortierella ambigua]|uniref:Uncharacterized protein n=1 Tax=Actinomortierella ambigua TaxID=1343610 RepID=A0A9P6QAL2_9FUNG|nr:hypothetical protein DFQ27_001277 [Actinomortierella ambigua]
MEADNTVAGRAPATKVGGMRIPNADHQVPLVRKEHDKKRETNTEEDNEDQRELERTDRLEYEKLTRQAAAERQARDYQNHPKQEKTNNFRQRENIHVAQPILHTHSKSGAAALNQ